MLLFLFNLENLVAIATIVSGLAAAISSYLAVQALVEVRKQRETTYQPEIILGSGHFNIYSRTILDRPKSYVPWEYTYKPKIAEYVSNLEMLKPLDIEFFNIGLGAAKNVVIECDTDINDWKEYLHRMSVDIAIELPFTFDTNITPSPLQFVRSASYLGINGYSFDTTTKLDLVNHILPTSVDKEPRLFELPHHIFYFLSTIIYIKKRNMNSSNSIEPHELPMISIKIEYFDIANKKIQKHFVINIAIPELRKTSRGYIMATEVPKNTTNFKAQSERESSPHTDYDSWKAQDE